MPHQQQVKRPLVRALTAALCAVSALAAAAAAVAAPAVGSGELLFMSNRAGSVFEYYRMQPEGGRAQRLLPEPGEVNELSVSPGGTHALYTRPAAGGLPNVFVTALASGETKQLTQEKLPVTQPTWSPDGRSIAFVSMREGIRKVFLMDADGRNVRRATDAPATFDEIAPAFSPDGTKLALLVSSQETATRVGAVTLADGKLRLLNPEKQRRYETPPVWSPDGSRVLFSVLANNAAQVMSAAADGSGAVALTRGDARNNEAQWSPDGSRVLFLSTPFNGSRAALKVARADGSEVRSVYDGGRDVMAARWSCDGSRILLVDYQADGGQIVALGADGKELGRLSHGEGFDANLQVHCGTGAGAQRLAGLR